MFNVYQLTNGCKLIWEDGVTSQSEFCICEEDDMLLLIPDPVNMYGNISQEALDKIEEILGQN